MSHIALRASNYEYYCSGACNTTRPPPKGEGGVVLMGGGTDVDAAFQWMGRRSGGGGLLVLRTGPRGDDAYDDYIMGLGKVAWAATLILLDATASDEPFVLKQIAGAAAIFFAGGDQSEYWRYWGSTPVQKAVQARADAGCPIGGTSAGEAILSGFVNSALTGSVTSREALANPYDRRITVSDAFLTLPHLAGVLADMHFVTRDRLGRLLAMLARLQQDQRMTPPGAAVRGIGVDEKTALLVEPSGRASIVGRGTAYFLTLLNGTTRVCEKGAPLSLGALPAYRLDARDASAASFDLSGWVGGGGVGYNLSVTAGALSEPAYGPPSAAAAPMPGEMRVLY